MTHKDWETDCLKIIEILKMRDDDYSKKLVKVVFNPENIDEYQEKTRLYKLGSRFLKLVRLDIEYEGDKFKEYSYNLSVFQKKYNLIDIHFDECIYGILFCKLGYDELKSMVTIKTNYE